LGIKLHELLDIPIDSCSSYRLPLEPLIVLHNSPLGFDQEASSSFNPFLQNLIIPPSVEAHNCILQNLGANLGVGRVGGNQPPPLPLNPWVMARFIPLNQPPHLHDLLENYLKFFVSTGFDPVISVQTI
jgi:hypothetical protein